MSNHYDVIIVGTGAGGGTLVHRLADSGKKILVLERGDFVPREQENWSAETVFAEGKYNNAETWVDKKGKPFQAGTHYFVGGNTKFYGAALLRFRESDFGEVKHHGGVSPAWPISYDDLAPYYLEAEKLYKVHGERGSDPTEPKETEPFPYPAVSHEPRVQELSDALKESGLKPFPVPLAIDLNEDKPMESTCIRCRTCDGFPCLVNAKCDSDVICMRPAMKYDNVQVLTNRFVERVLTDKSGRVATGVECVYGEERENYTADIVVVSAGAINSAALLLRSANESHPNGLANGSDVVGRNYMCHNNSAMVALSKQPNPTKFQKTLALNDFYYGSEEWDFPMGHIQMLGKSDPAMFKADAPFFTPGFALEQMASHALDFWLTSEDLPDPENRVTLTDDGQIKLSYTENNVEGHKRLTNKLKSLLKHIGCHDHLLPCELYLGKKIPLAGVAHQCGTVRFGEDPATSALDTNCKAHELDNLYVVDGSFFVSSTAVNPALTIIANALRVGDHLKERMGV